MPRGMPREDGMACLLMLPSSQPLRQLPLRPPSLLFLRHRRAFTHASLHHYRSAHLQALVQKNNKPTPILPYTPNGCSARVKRKMGLSPSIAVNAFLLSCLLLLGSFHNDVASAAFGLDFFSEQNPQIEPRKGNCATCLGVVDETLGACGMAANCVSSFDDRPTFFMAPWEFPGKLTTAFKQINRILLAEGGDIVGEGNRYIHAVFTEKDGTIDDLEFLFSVPSEDATVNIRSASRKISQNDYGRNRKRLEKIKQALTWEEVPILRNRSRALFFLESPWDTFGPEPPPGFDHEDKLKFVPD